MGGAAEPELGQLYSPEEAAEYLGVHVSTVRNWICAAWFEGMEWIRSFHHPESGTLTCDYRAESEADVRRHAELADVPCDDVRAVSELLPTPEDEFVPDRSLTMGMA